MMAGRGVSAILLLVFVIGVYLDGGGSGQYHVAGRVNFGGVHAMKLTAHSEVELEAESEAEVESETEAEAEVDSEVESEAESESESEMDASADTIMELEYDVDPKENRAVVASDDDYPNCQTCVTVLERIKHGTGDQFGIAFGARPWFLPTICNVMWKKEPETYAPCHQVLHAVRNNGRSIFHWLHPQGGCYENYIYQRRHWIHPCPSHVVCSVLRDFRLKPFCGSEKRVSQYALKSVNNEPNKEE